MNIAAALSPWRHVAEEVVEEQLAMLDDMDEDGIGGVRLFLQGCWLALRLPGAARRRAKTKRWQADNDA